MNVLSDIRILTRYLYDRDKLTLLGLELSRATFNYPDFQSIQIRKLISQRIIEFDKI